MYILLFNVVNRQIKTHLTPASSFQPLTQHAPVRTNTGYINCIRPTCVKLRERSGYVHCCSTLFMCDYPCYCNSLECFPVFVLMFVCVCIHTVLLACLVILCTVQEQVVLCFQFFCFCCCVLWVLLSLAFPHLTIYSKVSFSAGLQGNDTEDYCLDQ